MIVVSTEKMTGHGLGRRHGEVTRRIAHQPLDGAQLGGWLDLDRVAFDGPLNLDGAE